MALLLFLLLSSIRAVAAATCYTPNGTDRNAVSGNDAYKPCSDIDGEISMCCQKTYGTPDNCRSGGLCFNPGSKTWWRESCTDPTWQSPACIKLFMNGTGLNGTGPTQYDASQKAIVNDVPVTPCDDGSWCYGGNNRACCQQGQGVFIKNGTQTSQNPAGSSSPAASSSSPQPGGLSTGAKTGIGVGVSLGVLLLIALVIFFLRRRSRTGESWSQAYSGQGQHDDPKAELAGRNAPQEKHQHLADSSPLYEMEGNRP